MIDLHIHTKYSLLDSNIEPKELIAKIKEQGKTAICVTEHGNLYSSIEIYKECQKNGVKYLHGCEMYICDDVNIKDKNSKYYHLVVISKNEIGRLNLIKLVSESNKYKYYGKPRIDFNMLQEYKDGLIVLSACMAGEIQRNLINYNTEEAKKIAIKYKNIFGDDYYLEYQSHSDSTQQQLNRQIVNLANDVGIKYVVTCDSHYLNREDQKYHNIFVQIGQSREVGETYNDCYVQSETDIYYICKSTTSKENEIAISNTHEIADKCNVTIPLSAPIMPHVVKIPNEYKTEIDYLKHLCINGWESRKLNLLSNEEKNAYKKRLSYEISVIEKMGFEGYYLMVWSYANSVKRRGIARGSGGGSLVAYLLNIVDTDPVKYGLYFERFIDVGALQLLENGKITKSQLKIPDFDLDFGKEDRNKVLAHAINQYGADRVASLGSFQYIWAKGAIKDIGKVLGIPFEITNEMTSKLGKETIQEVLELGLLDSYKEKYPELFDYANRLAGLPKSFSAHPCFPENSLVLTEDGYKEIQDIKIGDKVLTHNCNYKLVVNTSKNKTDNLITLNACGIFPIKCTPNHPFYVRHRLKGRLKKYSNPEWVEAKDIVKSDMLCFPINQESQIPTYKNLNLNNEDMWWVIGRYIGDGWCEYYELPRNEKRVIICCSKINPNEINDILDKVNKLFETRITEERTVFKIYLKNNQLFEYLQQFGKYADKKHLTKDVLNLPVNLLKNFIEGYLSADGSVDKNGFYYFKTCGFELANGLIQCIAKVYQKHCGTHILKPKNEYIEGRLVKSKEKYFVNFCMDSREKQRNYYDNNCMWLYVKSVSSDDKKADVYNLSVVDDNTYTVNNIAVHNCGKVICTNDVIYYNAVDINEDGDVILQGDMHTAEDLGLIKADFLGLRTVDVIYDVLDMIGKDYEYIAPHNINFNDENVLRNFREGNTAGIFQFESSGMQSTLKNIECNSLYDLTVANALFRPGSMAYINNYADRRKGIEEYEFLHEDLKPILKNSYAIIVFQEQLIEIGRLANLSNPDELRQATAKKKPELLEKIKPELFNGLSQRGWNEDQLNKLWEDMLAFARYSFNKSHALAYAMIAYICMYLKVYHPREFICAWINSYKGKTEKLPDCISEAHRLNVKVYNPVFGEAEGKTFLYNDGIMVGVGAIKYCNTQIADELMNLSSNKYNSFINLLSDINSNTSINSKQLTILTGLNFFSAFGSNKYLLEVIDIYNKFNSCKIIKKDKLQELGLSEYYMKKYAGKETEKQYGDLDNVGIINELCSKLENKPMSIIEHIKFELEYLGYTTYTNPAVSEFYYIVLEFKTYKDATRPYLVLRNIKTGDENKARITQGKIFKESPFGQFSVLKIKEFEKCFKKKNIGGDWVVTDEIEDILEKYEVIK